MLASARPHPPPIQPGLTYGGGKDLMGDLMGDMMVDIIFKKMKNEKLKKNENFSKKPKILKKNENFSKKNLNF